jgi:hypothetical protein
VEQSFHLPGAVPDAYSLLHGAQEKIDDEIKKKYAVGD